MDNKKLLPIGLVLLIIVAIGGFLVLGGGDDDDSSGGSDGTSTGSGNDSPVATQTGGNDGGGGGGDDLASIAQEFTRVRSFKATVSIEQSGQAKIEMKMEYVAPDKTKMTIPGASLGMPGELEIIMIGNTTYTKLGGQWTKSTDAGLAGNLFDPNDIDSSMGDIAGAKKGDTATVSGKRCQIYTTGTTEVCVADKLPLRIVDNSTDGKFTIIFSDFNGNFDIKAPI